VNERTFVLVLGQEDETTMHLQPTPFLSPRMYQCKWAHARLEQPSARSWRSQWARCWVHERRKLGLL